MDKKVQAALLFVLAIFIFMAGTKYGDVIMHIDEPATEELIIDQKATEKVSTEDATPKDEEVKEINVHVSGAVKRPGVYKLDTKARVNDAVQLALPLPDADINMLNLAEKLRDGQKIIVPEQGEIVQNTGTISPANTDNTAATSSSSTLININTATAQELDELPGIGPAYAERIIQYRNEHGLFEKPEDIQSVQGIGPKKYEDLKERITVN